MKQLRAHLILTFILVSFGVVYYFDVQSLPMLEERLIVEVLFWLTTILLVIENAKIIFKVVKEKKKTTANQVENNVETSKKGVKWYQNKKLLLYIGCLIYILMFNYIGFFVSSFIFMVAANYLLGTRRMKQMIGVPIVVLAVTFLIFVLVLDVHLPKGILI